METLIKYLQNSYQNEIIGMKRVSKAELEIKIGKDVIVSDFSQQLQNELIAHIDKLEVVKIDIVDTNGKLVDSFATNQ